jgi:1-acyl-sn-glycerol-3-phosphate acyltransferase
MLIRSSGPITVLAMQQVVIDKPYQFVPPYRGTFWVMVFHRLLPRYLWRTWGIRAHELRGVEHLQASVDAGHGIVIAPNHARPCDPMVIGFLSNAVHRPFYAMASWHVFHEGGRFRGWLANRLGAFSIHRWGMDREALKAAIGDVAAAERPLVLFPEGIITRTNDRLNTLLDGTAFIARSAAKQRAKKQPPGQVVVHPVAIKYFFQGDPEAATGPVLDAIEHRLSWQRQDHLPLRPRIAKVGEALLTLKELEFLGAPQTGTTAERRERLMDRLLRPLEEEWVAGRRENAVTERVKLLRGAIVPNMMAGDMPEDERARRWRQLADIYLAQQVACYPPDYLASDPTPERMLETVERFEEDLTDVARVHRPWHVVLQVAPAVPVSPERERSGEDPTMRQLEDQLRHMLAELATKRPVLS